MIVVTICCIVIYLILIVVVAFRSQLIVSLDLILRRGISLSLIVIIFFRLIKMVVVIVLATTRWRILIIQNYHIIYAIIIVIYKVVWVFFDFFLFSRLFVYEPDFRNCLIIIPIRIAIYCIHIDYCVIVIAIYDVCAASIIIFLSGFSWFLDFWRV